MDEKLHQIADGLTAFQKKYFYRVIAKITVDSGYVHQYGMEIETYDTEWDWFSLPDEDRKALRDLLRDFAGWMYKQIDAEWDSRMSEENVDEVIRGNDYTFTASGKRSNGNG